MSRPDHPGLPEAPPAAPSPGPTSPYPAPPRLVARAAPAPPAPAPTAPAPTGLVAPGGPEPARPAPGPRGGAEPSGGSAPEAGEAAPERGPERGPKRGPERRAAGIGAPGAARPGAATRRPAPRVPAPRAAEPASSEPASSEPSPLEIVRLDPHDAPERRIAKLERINAALMRRVEQQAGGGGAYGLFERAATLEAEVRARTRELDRALDLLNESNARLEAAGRETEGARADLAGAIEAIDEGFALFDPADRLVLCNARFGRDLPDVRPHLVPGLAFEDYVARVSRSPHLALRAEAPALWAKRRLKHHRAGHAAFNVPLAGERWLQVSERRTPAGGTVVLQTEVTDILRLARAERDRMLDDQARALSATLDHIAHGLCVFDERARLIGWNASAPALLALPVTQLRLGTGLERLLDALAPEPAPEGEGGAGLDALRGWARRPPPRAPLSIEIERAGRRVALAAQAMPQGLLVTASDVTAEREALRVIREANETLERRVRLRTIELEDALALAERALATRSRFVAAASHDLLQPLSAAKLYLGSLDFEAHDPRAAAAAKAAGALESVEAMLDALLHISRLDSGRSEMHVRSVALGPLLRRLQDEFAPLAEARGLRLRVVPTRAVVRSDATYLRRILQNLIANAVRYTAAGGVLVGARRAGGSLRVEVIDTGPGIAEADLGAVFEEFRRLGSAPSSEGMGLGLAIVERACGLLGHPLEVASELGRGSRFAVTLPLAPAAGAGEARAAPGAGTAPLLLVVEREARARGRAAARIEALGFGAIEAPDPESAQALVEQLGVSPDAVLGTDPALRRETARRLAPACGRLPSGPLPRPLTRAALDAILAPPGPTAPRTPPTPSPPEPA